MTRITAGTRCARAAGIGGAGMAVALAITLTDHAFHHDWGFVRAATAGAYLAGLVFAGAFGQGGAWGWFRAGAGFAAATVLGAALAVLLLPFEEMLSRHLLPWPLLEALGAALIGPVYVIEEVLGSRVVAGSWLAALAALQGLSRVSP